MYSTQQRTKYCWITDKKLERTFHLSTKMDRRKQYTRKVLKESLMTLLKSKTISSITVKEICKLADINRSTYYAHFANQYELLESIEEEFIEDLVHTLNQYNFSKAEEALQLTEALFEYIALKSEICQTLLSENTDIHFHKKGMDIVQKFVFHHAITDNKLEQETYEYINLFLVSGTIYVIKNWLENGQNKSPKEMAEILHNFTYKGLTNIR